jgi:hypothetical protein
MQPVTLIHVSVKTDLKSVCPGTPGEGMLEFVAIELNTKKTFHGTYDADNNDDRATYRLVKELKASALSDGYDSRVQKWYPIMKRFDEWIKQFPPRYEFISDNLAYDWQWINYYFLHTMKENPLEVVATTIKPVKMVDE